MARCESPALRRWDGKSKVATAWDPTPNESGLFNTDANCSIYLSYEARRRGEPSFKIPFDRLVMRQCQPLIRKLIVDPPDSDTLDGPPRLELPGIESPSVGLASTSSSCSLILPPPSDLSEDEASRYNVTTRNFFAWAVGEPIVGTDPTYALIALKPRMDVWRAPSCNNASAIQQYARSQFYSEPTILDMFQKPALQTTSILPLEYKLTSTSSDAKSLPSGMNTAVRLGQSLGRRATAVLRRRLTAPDLNSRDEVGEASAESASAQAYSQLKDSTLRNHALLDDSNSREFARSSSSLVDASQSGSDLSTLSDSDGIRHLPSLVTSISTMAGTNSSVTTPDGTSELSGLDSLAQHIKAHNFSRETTQPQVISMCQSPVSMDPAAPLHSPSTTYLRPDDHLRSQSRGPPSPILEEIVIGVKQSSEQILVSPSNHSRRSSLPPGTSRSRPPSRPTSFVEPGENGQRALRASDKQPERRQTSETKKVPHKVCTQCRRCKKPRAPESQKNIPRLDPMRMNPPFEQHSPVSPVEQNIPVQDPPKKPEKIAEATSQSELMEEVGLLRFPSLRRLRSKELMSRTLTVHDQVIRPERPKPKRAKSTPVSRLNKSRPAPEMTVFKITPSPQIPRGTPLSEQRYTPSLRSLKSRTSEETIRESSSIPPTLSAHRVEEAIESRPSSHGKAAVLASRRRLEGTEISSRPTSSKSMVESISRRRSSFAAASKQEEIPKPPALPVLVSEENWLATSGRAKSPESSDFAVMMKSNGSKQSLALLLEDIQHQTKTAIPTTHHEESSQSTDDDDENQIILDRLLNGLEYMGTNPKHIERTPTQRKPSGNAETSTTRPSPPTPSDPPTHTRRKSVSFTPTTNIPKPPPRSWTGSLRLWKTKKDVVDHSQLPTQIIGANGQIQIRVLSMDSSGNFSTSMVDLPSTEDLTLRY